MHLALLFNDQGHPSVAYAGMRSALRAILSQDIERPITLRSGSLVLGHLPAPLEVADRLFTGDTFRLLDPERFRREVRESSIYVVVLANIDRSTAVKLDRVLASETTYVGMGAVNLVDPTHVFLFLRLGLRLRICGRRCGVFWRSFDPEGRDDELFAEIAHVGFESVEWEDLGLRGTIFDDFDSLDHWGRLAALRDHLAMAVPGGQDQADELLLLLEDLNPQLAATLGTAARTHGTGTTAEDFSQAGVSARRYMEQLADALFPPRDEPVAGRDVSRPKYKNRLWAYVDERLQRWPAGLPDPSDLGREVDRLLSRCCAAVHGHPRREEVGKLISDLALLTVGLILLDPEGNRDPYGAYAPRLINGLKEWIGGNPGGPGP